jgi:hypothetical protein
VSEWNQPMRCSINAMFRSACFYPISIVRLSRFVFVDSPSTRRYHYPDVKVELQPRFTLHHGFFTRQKPSKSFFLDFRKRISEKDIVQNASFLFFVICQMTITAKLSLHIGSSRFIQKLIAFTKTTKTTKQPNGNEP